MSPQIPNLKLLSLQRDVLFALLYQRLLNIFCENQILILSFGSRWTAACLLRPLSSPSISSTTDSSCRSWLHWFYRGVQILNVTSISVQEFSGCRMRSIIAQIVSCAVQTPITHDQGSAHTGWLSALLLLWTTNIKCSSKLRLETAHVFKID